jgi:TolA-binding protein/predicted negative regulator of RcsB-dependent stress response
MKRRWSLSLSAFVLLGTVLVVSPSFALEEADRLWLVGERAFADTLYPIARRALERFVTLYPSDPRTADATLMLARTRLALNDPAAALEAFRRAQTFVPMPGQPLEARFWEAETLFRLKRYGEARVAYDDVVRTNAASPLAPDALYGYAWSELELKRPEPAVTAFRDLLVTWPDHALAPSATLHLARALIDLKKPIEAQSLLAPFPTKYPSSRLVPDAQYLLGWLKTTTGDPRGALADLEVFVAANPSHERAPEARRLIMRLLGKYGDRQQLATAYTALMAQEPPLAEDLYAAAKIADQLGRPKDQDAAWKKLRAQFPEDPATRRLALDMASSAFKQKNWKDASALAQIAAQSNEDGVKSEAWLLSGEAELQLKRFGPAVKAFDAVGDVTGVEAGVRYRALAGLGLAREQQEEWRAALKAYESVASRSPDPTLRDWARQRVTAVKARLAQPAPGPAPPQKTPAPKKSGANS